MAAVPHPDQGLPTRSGTGPPLGAGVALSALPARADLGLRQVAGPAGDVTVSRVHTSEMTDPGPYLLGGELLLTAGLHLGPHASGDRDAYWDGYVRRTVAAGAAALGFGVAPVHAALPPALTAACDRHGLPLLEVPRRTPFVAVESAVWQALTAARHQELLRLGEAQRALATAAAGSDPVTAVLRALARHLDGWAVLRESAGAERRAAGRRPPSAVCQALAGLAARLGPGGPASAVDTSGGAYRAAYALDEDAGTALLVATGSAGPHAPTVAGTASVLLALLVRGAPTPTGPGHPAALVRLLLGATPEEVAPLLGGADWRVVRARPRHPEGDPASALGALLGASLVDRPPSTGGPGGGEEAATVRALVPADLPLTALRGWTLGVSDAVDVARLPDADRRADHVLRRALATGTGLARQRPAPPGGVGALVPPEEARARARAQLAPLLPHPALLETLRSWLSLHGGWDRTATALCVHRNTVRQRIGRVAALLDTDLDDPDARAELWLALRHLGQ